MTRKAAKTAATSKRQASDPVSGALATGVLVADNAAILDGDHGTAEVPPAARARRRRRSLADLEDRIGYRFANPKLAECALTHVSAHGIQRGKRAATGAGKGENYQRLEFLGDRVLGLVISERLYRTFPAADEGELSRRLADLVRKETCAEVAQVIELASAIRVGASEESAGGRLRAAILADVCEALIGAIYLDGGSPAAAAFIARFWDERLRARSGPRRDPKTALQEWAQARGLPPPRYSEVERTGPHHDPEFRIRADVSGFVSADGIGRSKREAEKAAAAAFLTREGVPV